MEVEEASTCNQCLHNQHHSHPHHNLIKPRKWSPQYPECHTTALSSLVIQEFKAPHEELGRCLDNTQEIQFLPSERDGTILPSAVNTMYISHRNLGSSQELFKTFAPSPGQTLFLYFHATQSHNWIEHSSFLCQLKTGLFPHLPSLWHIFFCLPSVVCYFHYPLTSGITQYLVLNTMLLFLYTRSIPFLKNHLYPD